VTIATLSVVGLVVIATLIVAAAAVIKGRRQRSDQPCSYTMSFPCDGPHYSLLPVCLSVCPSSISLTIIRLLSPDVSSFH